MQLLCKDIYLNLNRDRSIPYVSERVISAYLRAKGNSIRQCHTALYFMKIIKFIRSSSAALPMTFAHSQGRPKKKQKKKTSYFVDLSLNKNGSIAEGLCENTVGSGLNAIVIVLLALVDHLMKVPVMKGISSTQISEAFMHVSHLLVPRSKPGTDQRKAKMEQTTTTFKLLQSSSVSTPYFRMSTRRMRGHVKCPFSRLSSLQTPGQ
ncbi:hypothetical protein PoB_000335000 [Plakobranchus ocellatus]|uniref:Uncharacterized protein n=1 Tax=Plakobranchus ocellatus TaxID=259542 RepID=A0AAV3Y1R6_9GAST|nr:hypothetical protein PoB_000335000 [Plakobranchus ocellatus]